jgi:hypothetical protein
MQGQALHHDPQERSRRWFYFVGQRYGMLVEERPPHSIRFVHAELKLRTPSECGVAPPIEALSGTLQGVESSTAPGQKGPVGDMHRLLGSNQ